MKKMNCEIKKLEKSYLKNNIEAFKDILYQADSQYWTDKHFLLELSGKWEYSCVAVSDSIPVGFCICSQKKADTVHFHKFFVDKKFRKQGIGQALIGAIKLACLAGGIKKVTLNTHESNAEAIHIYEKFFGTSIEIFNSDEFGKRYFMCGSVKE